MSIAIFMIVLVAVISILAGLPTISIDASAVSSSHAFQFVRAGLYFLPVRTVTIILLLLLSLWTFRTIVALVKTLWDVLPVGKGK